MHLKILFRASYMAQWQRIYLPTQETQETQVPFLDQEDPLKEGMTTLSSILAWRIPWTRGAWWATADGVEKESETT